MTYATDTVVANRQRPLEVGLTVRDDVRVRARLQSMRRHLLKVDGRDDESGASRSQRVVQGAGRDRHQVPRDDAVEEGFDAPGQVPLLGSNDARLGDARPVGGQLQHAVTGGAETWIETEDSPGIRHSARVRDFAIRP